MASLIAYYSRAGENYFGGSYRRIPVGNTEQVANMLAQLTGGDRFHIQQKVPYSDDYQACVAQARQDPWQNKTAGGGGAACQSWTTMTKFTWAIPTTAAPCPWRCTPSWSTTTSPARPSTPSAPGVLAVSPRRNGTSGCGQEALW